MVFGKKTYQTKYAFMKDLKLEHSVLKSADTVISVSKSIINLFKQKVENKYFVIPNGYDEDDFKDVIVETSEFFNIVYTGSLRLSQIPHNFFSVLATLKKNKLIGKIRVKFFGTTHPDVLEIINKNNLNDIVHFYDYVDHNEMLTQIVSADMLLLLIPDTNNNEGILTGKLFEYIGSKKFILGFGPKHGDAAIIINDLQCGKMLEYKDDPKQIIIEKYNYWLEQKPQILESYSEQYTRKNLTKSLCAKFDTLL